MDFTAPYAQVGTAYLAAKLRGEVDEVLQRQIDAASIWRESSSPNTGRLSNTPAMA
jgi:hypothetical protein